MSTKATGKTEEKSSTGITAISVAGYKSLSRPQRLEIKPLTLLAGANSSGKSSAIQPLLLLKQTMDSTYDAGPLLLNGPNVRFTSADQLLSRMDSSAQANELRVGAEAGPERKIELIFRRRPGKRLDLDLMTYTDLRGTLSLSQHMSEDEIRKSLPAALWGTIKGIMNQSALTARWTVIRDRCFLTLSIADPDQRASLSVTDKNLREEIQRIIHVPALRGNPERAYPKTAVEQNFPGTFDKYVASIVALWQSDKDRRLRQLNQALQELGLTSTVKARPVDETQIELQVGRLPSTSRQKDQDLVNIADVGYGVSQVLPVIIALLVAAPGQLVYVEQPEIHLHPRAQAALAKILADGAERGVRVVVETHSTVLLLALQTLVAEGKLAPNLVKLHWFSRQKDGSTDISSADIDESGAFGDWPVDFADVLQETESRYLDAAEESLVR